MGHADISPECDRSFTRSDARMKHMRTIHLAEALRQQQPSTDVSGKQTEPEQPVKGRPKIILKMQGGGNLRRGTESSTANGDAATDTTAGDDDHSPDRAGTALSQYEELLAAWEHGPLFTAEERATPPDKLMRLLELRLRLAEEEGDALRRECDELEKEYRREWLEKEILLEQMIEAEVAWNDRRRAVLAGEVDVKVDGARAGTVPRENAEDEEAKPREFPIIQQGPTVRT